MDNRSKTMFVDIDGTLIKHRGLMKIGNKTKVLPGVLKKLEEWDKKGYNIILVSGRRESLRAFTEKQLEKAKIIYDQLILGIGGGIRVLINDTKPNSSVPTAKAISVKRNVGLENIDE